MTRVDLPDIATEELRALADAGYVSTAKYVSEIERRRREQAEAARLVALESLGEDMPECDGDLLHHPITGGEA
jgi:hypothetical protein